MEARVKWGGRELTLPLGNDGFRRRVGRTRLADGARRAILTSQNELDAIIGIRVVHRYIPVASILLNRVRGLEFRTAKSLKQKPPFLGERGIVKIPIGEKPVRVSRHNKHLTVPRWEFAEIIEFPIFNRRPLCFETRPVLSGFVRPTAHSKSILIFHRVLAHDKQTDSTNRVLQPKESRKSIRYATAFSGSRILPFFLSPSQARPDPIFFGIARP